MSQNEIEIKLIAAIVHIQQLSGREYLTLDGNSNVFDACPGFDSLNAVEVTTMISNQFNLNLEFNNAFVDGNKVLTISESAKRIQSLLK